MLSLRDCCPFHTNFSEDLFQCPFNNSIKFELKDNIFISDEIDVYAIFDYCKNKYNYKNDEIYYFDNVNYVDKMEPFNIYYDVGINRFMIPIELIENVFNIIPFGMVKKEDIEREIRQKDTLLFKV